MAFTGHRKSCLSLIRTLSGVVLTTTKPRSSSVAEVFPNVPLIGTKGGISYNPALARRQYGYPMKNIPSNIQLEDLFFKNIDDHGNMLKKEIVQAWRLVHSKGRRLLGKHLCISLDPYLQWVRVRAFKLRMPYQHQEPIPLREP